MWVTINKLEDKYIFQIRGGWGGYESELFQGEVIFASEKIGYTSFKDRLYLLLKNWIHISKHRQVDIWDILTPLKKEAIEVAIEWNGFKERSNLLL